MLAALLSLAPRQSHRSTPLTPPLPAAAVSAPPPPRRPAAAWVRGDACAVGDPEEVLVEVTRSWEQRLAGSLLAAGVAACRAMASARIEGLAGRTSTPERSACSRCPSLRNCTAPSHACQSDAAGAEENILCNSGREEGHKGWDEVMKCSWVYEATSEDKVVEDQEVEIGVWRDDATILKSELAPLRPGWMREIGNLNIRGRILHSTVYL